MIHESDHFKKEYDCCGAEPKAEAPAVGQKFDGGKDRWSLLMRGCSLALRGVIRVLMFGAKKYAADSWQRVPGAEDRYTEALYRHLDAIAAHGLTAVDEESGELHIHHVSTNALFLGHFAQLRKDNAQPSS